MYRYLPDFVSGDFDSIDPDLLKFYKEKVGHDTAMNVLTINQLKNQSINQSASQSFS